MDHSTNQPANEFDDELDNKHEDGLIDDAIELKQHDGDPKHAITLTTSQQFYVNYLKRLSDIVISGSGLLVLLPFLLLVALVVKCTSKGGAFFYQQRMGRNLQPFWIYKFRTMVADAPKKGAQVTSGTDPRITGVGKYLRATKVDELPQLLNVLKGEMSLVGPRPEVPKYVEMFVVDFQQILQVRPGITDLASIEFRDEESLLAAADDPEREYVEKILPAKLQLCRKYLQGVSLMLDIRIVWKTLIRVIRK